jgi:hypothetical protein
MSTPDKKLVDKIGQVPEHVNNALYRYGHTYYTLEDDGATLRDTEREANALKLSWDEPIEVFSWVEALLSSDDAAAVELAKVIPHIYSENLLEVISVGTSPSGLIALSEWHDKDYAVSIEYRDGNYSLYCYRTGDEYVAGTPEGAAYRAGWMATFSRPFKDEN